MKENAAIAIDRPPHYASPEPFDPYSTEEMSAAQERASSFSSCISQSW